MNIFRAGFFSFASTTTWLHETGMASPPLLVALGLTLPNSRILSGVASIGLTLANIAAILPHLRQPILNSMDCLEKALRSTEEITLCLDGSSTMQSGNLPVESTVLASGSPRNGEDSNTTQPLDQSVESPESPVLALRLHREREHQGQPLACSATTEVICSAEKEALGCLNVESEVASQTALPPSVGRTDDNEALSQTLSSLDADSSRARISASHLFAQEGWGLPLLSVPDAEVIFFETDDVSYESAPGEGSIAARQGDAVPEEHSAMENNGSTTGEDGQLLVVHLPGAQSRVELDMDMAIPVADGNAWSPPRNDRVRGHQNDLVGISTLPDDISVPEPALRNVQLDKRRPECLEFIPQSVIRRNPSAPMASAGRCFGHCTFNPGHDHQFPSAPPVALVSIHNPEMLLQETKPPANYTTPKGHWGVSFLTPTRWFVDGNTPSVDNVLAHQSVNRRPTSLPEPPRIHEPTRLQKRPTHPRRLGVLARAALRDRRAAARKRIDDENDDSSAPESNSDPDSDSQYSSGSSTYEGMLPHILGTDLIAAIDADDESELNLCGPKKTGHSPLNLYEDFLNSEDSTADVSVIMQVSSNGDDSDGEVGVPATSRRLTYEDIQQWATGVVQKCVRQVCRNHVAAEPSSPSQASDVCAERPSGSGASQCPLSGLHCKLGAAASTDEVPAPGTKQVPVALPPTSTQPSRKPLQLRNLRDIPEFVPRQRLDSARAGNPRRITRSGIDATREAATQAIARMENQAGSNARRWLTGGKRTINTAGDGQGALRRA